MINSISRISVGLILATSLAFAALQREPGSDQEKQIQQLIASLPDTSLLRAELQKGMRGDGVHQPWMDEMRRQGVKCAWIIVDFGLHKQPQNGRVREATYYSGYDGGATQIVDPQWLERIRGSGLASTLDKVALAEAPNVSWYKQDLLFVPIELFDDEGLPPITPATVRGRLATIRQQLEPKSDLRLELANTIGDGADYLWTSKMREEGVKRAVVSFDISFRDDGSPKDVTTHRIQYYTAYDDDKAAVSDQSRLRQIRTVGLEEMLQKVALERAKRGMWVDVPRPRPKPFIGSTEVEFYDDPWLPSFDYPLFTTYRQG